MGILKKRESQQIETKIAIFMSNLIYPIIEYPINIERKLNTRLTGASFSEEAPGNTTILVSKPNKRPASFSFYLVFGLWLGWITLLLILFLLFSSPEILAALGISATTLIIPYQYFKQDKVVELGWAEKIKKVRQNNKRRKMVANPSQDVFFSQEIDWTDNVTELLRSNKSHSKLGISIAEQMLKQNFVAHLKRLPGHVELGNSYSSKKTQYNTWLELILSNGLGINIEIDTPYETNSKEPTNCCDSNDNLDHNNYFLGNGWIIVRFTEKQVATNPQGCSGVLAELIIELTQDRSVLETALAKKGLKRYPQWSFAESKLMAKEGYRDKYLSKLIDCSME